MSDPAMAGPLHPDGSPNRSTPILDTPIVGTLTPGTPTHDPGAVRIGHAEREAAIEALRVHHSCGRIDSREYEDRSVRARQAKSAPVLDELFTDLPQPHAVRPVPGTLMPGAPQPEPVAEALPRSQGLLKLPDTLATTIVSLSPIVSIVLFFWQGSFLWWFLVPVVAVLVYGPDRTRTRPGAPDRPQDMDKDPDRDEKG